MNEWVISLAFLSDSSASMKSMDMFLFVLSICLIDSCLFASCIVGVIDVSVCR